MNWKPVGMRPSDYVVEMRAAMEHKLYISALNAALIIPDVCATALGENNRTSSKKYIAWAECYLIPILREESCLSMSASDIYQLRNSVLHNGSLAPDAGKLTKYHNVRFHVFASDDQLLIGAGSIEIGKKATEDNREFHLTVNLARYVECVGQAVATFLLKHPECNREIDKGRLSYGAITDFTSGDETSDCLVN